MRWSVEIQKSGLETRMLSDLLEGLGYTLVHGHEHPALTSRAFDGMNSSQEVWTAAMRIRDAFIGPAEIDTEFMLGSVVDYSFEPPKRHAYLEVNSVRVRTTTSSATLSIRPPEGLSKAELVQWEEKQEERAYQVKLESHRSLLEPIVKEPNAAKVLQLLNAGDHTGESLNKIYELMEGHPSRRIEFLAEFGIPKDEFNRFGDAVHNPVVSGDKARHAYEQKPRSTKPMSMSEAESFIRNLTKEWLASVRAR